MSEVLDPVLNNMDIIPLFMKLREQQSQREEKADSGERPVEGVCGGQRELYAVRLC